MPKPIRMVKPQHVAKNQAKKVDSRKQSFFATHKAKTSREVAARSNSILPEPDKVDSILWLLFWVELGRQNLKEADPKEDSIKTMSM